MKYKHLAPIFALCIAATLNTAPVYASENMPESPAAQDTETDPESMDTPAEEGGDAVSAEVEPDAAAADGDSTLAETAVPAEGGEIPTPEAGVTENEEIPSDNGNDSTQTLPENAEETGKIEETDSALTGENAADSDPQVQVQSDDLEIQVSDQQDPGQSQALEEQEEPARGESEGGDKPGPENAAAAAAGTIGAAAGEAIAQMKLEVIDFLDVGFGDSQMLSSGDSRLLIDTYTESTWGVLDSWLDSHSYWDFDIYISHYHNDHMGNVENLINDGKYNINKLYLPDYSYMTGSSSYMQDYQDMCESMMDTARDKGIEIVYLMKDSVFNVGDVVANVLWGADYTNSNHNTDYINNNSLVTKFTCGDISYLNAGDIEEDTEYEILDAGVDVSADIFKLSHHGGNSSNRYDFLKAVNASFYYYNYCEDTPSVYSPSDSWSYSPTQTAKKFGNVASVRYNGEIIYDVLDGVVTQQLERNYRTVPVYIYDEEDPNKLKRVVTQYLNDATTQYIDCRAYGGQDYSTTKRSGTYANDGGLMGNGGPEFYYVDNEPVTGWFLNDDIWYYFNPDTARKVTGWLTLSGQTYYLDRQGRMQTGFVSVGSAVHHFDDQGRQTKKGWALIDGDWYYFGDYNKLMFGIQTIGGKKYILDDNTGAMRTGSTVYRGKRYLCDSNGVLQGGGWHTVDGALYYVNPYSGTVTTGKSRVNGETYLFDEIGRLQTGFVEMDGKTYYYDEEGWKKYGFTDIDGGKCYTDPATGEVLTGHLVIDGGRYYFDPETCPAAVDGVVYCFGEDGALLKDGWKTIGANRYLADENGICATGWQVIEGRNYFFAEDGAEVNGWYHKGNDTYYVDLENAAFCTGPSMIGDVLYLFDDEGRLQRNGWKLYNGEYYYTDGSGECAAGWIKVNGKWYYMDSDGAMQTGRIGLEDGIYILKPSGEMCANGWHMCDGSWYYLDGSGRAAVGWRRISGNWFYMDLDGVMQTGKIKIGSDIYIFGPSGNMYANGWRLCDGSWYYLDGSGRAAVGWRRISGNWFYMDLDGIMQTGKIKVGSDIYILGPSGNMYANGWRLYNGKWYYLDDSGRACVGWRKLSGKWYYMDSEGVMLTGWQNIDGKSYYFNASGVWVG